MTTVELRRRDLEPDPLRQFERWFGEAAAAGAPQPEAMALASAAADGRPSARMVLLKGADERGFAFYTNLESRKARELAENPQAALLFHWHVPAGRQIRIEGRVEPVGRDESARYFDSRPHGSRLGAWASPQSRPVAGREELDRRLAEVDRRFAGDEVELPPFWGGLRVAPAAYEFWQHRADRLHDRFRYTPDGGGWRVERLGP